MIQVPAARTCGYSRLPRHRSRHPRASARSRPSRRVRATSEPTSRAQRTPACVSSRAFVLCDLRAGDRAGRTRGRSSARRPAWSGGCGRRPCPARSSTRTRRRPRRARIAELPLVVGRADPGDAAVLHQDATPRAAAGRPSRRRARRHGRGGGSRLAALAQHLDRLRDAALPGLGGLRAFDAEHVPAAVAVREAVEERARLGLVGEGRGQVRRGPRPRGAPCPARGRRRARRPRRRRPPRGARR